MPSNWGWKPYVPVDKRRIKAEKKIKSLKNKGKIIIPIKTVGRSITQSFWGTAWCKNLESYSDYSNRLPRGRTYLRNGSVIHLEIKKGHIEALVYGSSLYTVSVEIKAVKKNIWNGVITKCSGQIGSIVELLSGKLSTSVMNILTKQKTGLFPAPSEIIINCSCPDGATMCKHVAATLYGVGTRLDESPELLFLLRKVDQMELISAVNSNIGIKTTRNKKTKRKLKNGDLSALFGVEIGKFPLNQNQNQNKKINLSKKTKTKK